VDLIAKCLFFRPDQHLIDRLPKATLVSVVERPRIALILGDKIFEIDGNDITVQSESGVAGV
jgi:hypothetical protein